MEQQLGGLVTPGGKRIGMQALCEVFTRHMGNVFGTQILWLESLDAILNSTPGNQDVPLREPDDLKQLHDELTGRDDISFSA
jgi:hypothetical protein